MVHRTFIVFLSFGLLSCSAPGVKPQDANLLEAAVNISSGEFEGQLSREQFKLEESRDLLNSQSDQNQRLNSELQVLTAQKNDLNNQLLILQNENRRLEQVSNQAKAASSIQQLERDKQRSKIRNLNSSIAKLKSDNVSEGGNQEYEVKISSLEQEIEVLRRMISNQ